MLLNESQVIVLKIGSSLLIDEKGHLNLSWLDSLIDDIATLQRDGKKIILVSSGSVALGRKALGAENDKPLSLEEKQAAAACGQTHLIHAYQESLSRYNLFGAQVLLTLSDSEERRRYLNARNTLTTLLEAGVIPIINENDTVTTAELRMGDNDRLAARVAQMAGADSLILLSDIDGVYTANPNTDKNAQHIPIITTIDDKITNMAGGSSSSVGTGGMVTKLAAARIAINSGCQTLIARGNNLYPIKNLCSGGKHTLFPANETPHSARKRWIAHSLQAAGTITVDTGAIEALQQGASLLPAGITKIVGEFHTGDTVIIETPNGQLFGHGLVNYNSEEAHRIMGCKSSEIQNILGYSGRKAFVHRDDLAIE